MTLIAGVCIALAVLLSYPLQLLPALEIVEIFLEELRDDATSRSGPVISLHARGDCAMALAMKGDVECPSLQQQERASLYASSSSSSRPQQHQQQQQQLMRVDQEIELTTLSSFQLTSASVAHASSGSDARKMLLNEDDVMPRRHHDSAAGAIAAAAAAGPCCASAGARESSSLVTDEHKRLSDAEQSRDRATASVRAAIVLFTVAVPFAVPQVGLLVPLAGASSGAALSVILPPLIDIQLHVLAGDALSPSRMCLNALSIVIGIAGAVLGTLFAVENIFFAH